MCVLGGGGGGGGGASTIWTACMMRTMYNEMYNAHNPVSVLYFCLLGSVWLAQWKVDGDRVSPESSAITLSP